MFVVIGIATSGGEDGGDSDQADGSQAPGGATGGSIAGQAGAEASAAEEGAAEGPAGDDDEVDDVGACTLVDSETITLEVLNNSSEMSSYIIDVNYLDGADQRIADETMFVNHVRPDERAVEQSYAFGASGAASCVVAEVDRISSPSPDDTAEVTCQVNGVDGLGDIAVTLEASNGSSELSDYLISGSLVKDGTRMGTVDAVIENVPAGGSAPGDGFTTADGPADGVVCEVVYVERTSSEWLHPRSARRRGRRRGEGRSPGCGSNVCLVRWWSPTSPP